MSSHSLSEAEVTVLGSVHYRHHRTPFGIRRADRRHHLYILGKTGVGKSTLLAALLRQDVLQGEGIVLLDPHGQLVEELLPLAQSHRRADLIYLNPADPASKLTFNPLAQVPAEKRSLACSGILDIFKQRWPDFWGPRAEHLLRHCVLTLLELPFSNMADILRLLEEPAFVRQALPYIGNPQVRRFWEHEYLAYTARFRTEAISPIQNKLSSFLVAPVLKRLLVHSSSSFNLRQIMDEGKVLLVNLSQGRLGSDHAALLGGLLLSQLCVIGLTRVDMPPAERRDVYIYLDEFQTMATGSLAVMLAELRKYRLNLILAHQYISQLAPDIREVLLGNVGTIMAFRLGLTDAQLLAPIFYPVFNIEDLIQLPNHHCYLRLMVDGAESQPFRAVTLPRTK